ARKLRTGCLPLGGSIGRGGGLRAGNHAGGKQHKTQRNAGETSVEICPPLAHDSPASPNLARLTLNLTLPIEIRCANLLVRKDNTPARVHLPVYAARPRIGVFHAS